MGRHRGEGDLTAIVGYRGRNGPNLFNLLRNQLRWFLPYGVIHGEKMGSIDGPLRHGSFAFPGAEIGGKRFF
jgi:hypothetical protein